MVQCFLLPLMTAALTGVELISELALQMRRQMWCECSHALTCAMGVTPACTYSCHGRLEYLLPRAAGM